MKNCDVLIIGAGPSGSVAAAYLLKKGYSVIVLEKLEFPRFVIGESLLPHSMDYLEKTDLLKVIQDQKFQIKTGVSFYHNETQCEFLFKNYYTKGWTYTYQVKRAQFDHELIKEVERKGAQVYFNSEVIAVDAKKDIQTTTYKNKEGETHTIQSRFLIDASGYGRVLPRLFDLEVPAKSDPKCALFSHIKDEKRSAQEAENIFVHEIDENHAWVWSIPFSDNTASVGVVGSPERIEEYEANNAEKFRALINNFPGLKDRFENAEYIFEPRTILNYSVSVKSLYGDGYVQCGNSTEFLDPIFSSGVTLAVSSGYKAAELVANELNGEKVDWEKSYSDVMKKGIDVFRTYVQAWYSGDLATIFFSEEMDETFKSQICSVLAGYIWDETNPFVKKHDRVVANLAKVIRINEENRKNHVN